MSGEMKKGISGIPASLPRIALRRILITTGSHTDEQQAVIWLYGSVRMLGKLADALES